MSPPAATVFTRKPTGGLCSRATNVALMRPAARNYLVITIFWVTVAPFALTR
jgi:hypothetical protein